MGDLYLRRAHHAAAISIFACFKTLYARKDEREHSNQRQDKRPNENTYLSSAQPRHQRQSTNYK